MVWDGLLMIAMNEYIMVLVGPNLDKVFYESPSLSSSNRIEMNYAVSLQVWEDDVDPACDLQNGDQCEWTTWTSSIILQYFT